MSSNKHKLLTIKPTLEEWNENFRSTWKEGVALSRIHIGHTRITHSFLLKEVQPMCHACQTAYTIKYVLTECIDMAPTRKIFHSTSYMKKLFKKLK